MKSLLEEIRIGIALWLLDGALKILPEGLFKLKLSVFVRDNIMDL